ncbi:unnamed protein product, partial [Nesidiocoris tenuis]
MQARQGNTVFNEIDVEIGQIKLSALADTGASLSCINEKTWNKLKSVTPHVEEQCDITVTVGDSNQIHITRKTLIQIQISSYKWKFRFYIVPKLPADVLVGCDIIRRTRMILNLADSWYSFGFDRKRTKFPLRPKQIDGATLHSVTLDFEFFKNKYKDVLTPTLGLTHLVQHKIQLDEGAKLESKKITYHLPPPKLEILKSKIQDLLDKH